MATNYETLVDAIRNNATTAELKRMVGPSAEDLAASEYRLGLIDQMSNPNASKDWATQERLNQLIAQQGKFESEYL